MTQHDLFDNPNRRIRPFYPYFVALQADVAVGDMQVVAPLVVLSARVPHSRLAPVTDRDGGRYAAMLGLVIYPSVRLPRHAAGSIARYRNALTRTLDWLLWGI